MHELALTKDIVETVVQLSNEADATTVKSVSLTVGEGRDIVPKLFRAFFKRFAQNTIAENADLLINRTPLRVRCNQCGRVYPVDVRNQGTWNCPSCACASHDLYSGMEFVIDRIEVA